MIILHGVERAIAALEQKSAAMRAATRQATAKALHLIEKRAKEKLTTSSHAASEPTPSAPGEPPSLVTGNLRRSIKVTGPTLITSSTWMGQVGPTAVYGRIQELGGVTGRGGATTLPARPYMRPALEEVMPEITDLFRAAATKAILS
jgi:HK97 gp10 family phage protein